MLYRMVSFPVTFSDPDLVFKVTVVFDPKYLKNGAIFCLLRYY